jgi:hypothetical protein
VACTTLEEEVFDEASEGFGGAYVLVSHVQSSELSILKLRVWGWNLGLGLGVRV